MHNEKSSAAQTLPQSSRGDDAVFKGWQKTGSGRVFPLYTIMATGHPSRGSTVSDITLQRLKLHVPGVPPPEESDDEE